jgi:hypothetical protein
MLSANYFPNNLPRVFVPYKGWQILNEDGTQIPDELFIESEGPFKMIPDPLSHGNWHTLENLLDKNGKKLLPKGIRKITYYQDGYYLLEDNNEDELINRGDVPGGFLSQDYVSCMNVMRNDGTLLFDEWVDKIIPDIGFFNVRFKSGRWGRVKLSGEPIREVQLKFQCKLVFNDDKYAINNSFGERLSDDYTSIMFSQGKMWNVNLFSRGKEITYFRGQGEEIINYAQMILIKNNVIALLEKDNIWYSFDSLGNLNECFYWNPIIENK